jgi:hypothetical protein
MSAKRSGVTGYYLFREEGKSRKLRARDGERLSEAAAAPVEELAKRRAAMAD